jgi:hypothetical protein
LIVFRQPGADLVAMVTRLVVTQAAAAGAIGLIYSRRHGPPIVITFLLAIALCGLAAVVRTGSHAAWAAAVGVEGVFAIGGLVQFCTTRFLGGTLFALITLGVLVHPAVARGYGGAGWGRRPAPGGSGLGELSDAAADPFGGPAAG